MSFLLTRRHSDKTEALTEFQKLVQALARAGLATEVRNGGNCSLLVFLKTASDERLNKAVYRSRWFSCIIMVDPQMTNMQGQGLALWCSCSAAGQGDSTYAH